MRISKEQRKENILAVFKAMIQLSNDQGFDAITMKAIAKAAGIGEATIYNYFPKKEMLLTGYFDWSLDEALFITQQEPLAELSFTEIFHTLIENHLEILNPAKGFFSESVKALFVNPISLAQTSLSATKSKHSQFLNEQLEKSIEHGTYTAPPFKDFMVSLMWDYHVGVLYYWMKDEEPASLRTTELIDLSMKVLDELLRSDLFNKIYGVAHFLFKEHLLNKLLSSRGGHLDGQ